MGAASLICTGLGGLFLLLALAGTGFTIAAGLAIDRYRLPPPTPVEEPDVTLLKPLHGEEPGLRGALETFLRQDYGGRVAMRLGVQDARDPALAVARPLAREDDRVTLVLDSTQHGANRKVSNLVNLASEPLAALVVLSDSDIAVGADYLRRLAAALDEPGVGLVTCLYAGEAVREGPAARLSAMGVSYGFLPMGAVGVQVGATPSMGSTIALKAETLAAIGGFERVKDVLADDYEIGRAVRALGLKTVVPPFLVTHRCAESTLTELWRHEVRWAKTVRDLDPLGYAGSMVTHPLPLALIGWLLIAFTLPEPWLLGLPLALFALVARLWLKSRVDAVVGATSGPWWLLPGRDMLSLAVFVGAHVARRVEWRGARFHVGRGGELTPV